MSERDNGGPAFPAKAPAEVDRVIGSANGKDVTSGKEWVIAEFPGMSLRDWFAGQALANSYTFSEAKPDKVAEWAYQIADAMLVARK